MKSTITITVDKREGLYYTSTNIEASGLSHVEIIGILTLQLDELKKAARQKAKRKKIKK